MSLLANCIRPKEVRKVKFSKETNFENSSEGKDDEEEVEEEPYYDTPYDGPYKKLTIIIKILSLKVIKTEN